MFKEITTLSLAVAFCLLTSVCFAQDDADLMAKLQGKWKCDADKTVELMKESGVPDEQISMARELLGGMMMKITEDEIIMMAMGQERAATYEKEKTDVEKKWVQLKIEPEAGPARSVELTMDSDDTFKIKLDERTTMVFNREKEEEEKDDSDG